MRILVTGASGFVGSRLCEKLVKEGDEVVGIAKEYKRLKGVRLILCDLRKDIPKELARKRFDVIYHLAAILDENSPTLIEDNLALTRAALRIYELSKARQLIFLSSIGILGEAKKPLTEFAAYRPGTRYEFSKVLCELLLKKSRVNYTIVRCPPILGLNAMWKNIFKVAERGFPLLGSGENFFHLAYIEDVIDFLVLLKGNKKVFRQIFHLACKEPLQYRDFYRILIREFGKKPSFFPLWLAKLLFTSYEFVCSLTGRRPNFIYTRAALTRLTRNRLVSTRRIERMLGFRPKFSMEVALLRVLREYRTTKE